MKDPLVLIVDDQASQRLLTSESLLRGGFTVLEFESGLDALEHFVRTDVDAVVLDVMMPEISGFEVCERIRALPKGKHIPIMMMTARDDDDAITTAFEVGATDFISKPINPLILKQRMKYMLRSTSDADELRRNQMVLGHAEEMAKTGSWEWDCDQEELGWSSGFCDLFALHSDRHPGASILLDLFPAEIKERMAELLSDPRSRELPLMFEHAHNNRHFETRVDKRIHDLNGHLLISGTVQDMTEQRKSEAEIRQLAFFDTLTGLPNRTNLKGQLNNLVSQATKKDDHLVICHIDLDEFKRINEIGNRDTGDDILMQVAERAGRVLAGSEKSGAVARLSGDEFVFAFISEDPGDAREYPERLLQALNLPYHSARRSHQISASIGIAVCPQDGSDVNTLMRNADSALCEAKRRGKNRYLRYDLEIRERLVQRVTMEADLRAGIERDEFEVYYQPKVNTMLNQVVGMEALVRWNSPRGMISPAVFIPIAEEADLISEIGSFVLESACTQVATWLAKGMPELEIAVNLSAKQLESVELCEEISALLVRTSLPSHLLCLEITEGMMMENHERSISILNQLKALGCKVAVDDFGTGYSSLSYLQSFPIDTLKIDQSFVRDLAVDSDRHSIVSAVVRMAQALGLKVVAEGVEEAAQEQILRAMACDEIQGYLYSRPLPAAEYEEWLNNRISVSTVLKAVS